MARTQTAIVTPMRPRVPPDETKHDRFRRLANHRGKRTISALRALGKLSSSDYERHDGEVDAIETVLTDELRAAIHKLRVGNGGKKDIEDIL